MINTIKRHYGDKNGSLFWLPFFLLYLLLGLSLMTHSSSANADDNAAIKTWFKITPVANSLTVLPMCKSQRETPIRYEVTATKIGPSGRSKSSQGGQQILPAHQDITLSTLQFGLTSGDKYQFEMRIYVNNNLASSVTEEYP